jgi:hypothetical protein
MTGPVGSSKYYSRVYIVNGIVSTIYNQVNSDNSATKDSYIKGSFIQNEDLIYTLLFKDNSARICIL